MHTILRNYFMFEKLVVHLCDFIGTKNVTILCFEELVVNLYKLIRTKQMLEKKGPPLNRNRQTV